MKSQSHSRQISKSLSTLPSRSVTSQATGPVAPSTAGSALEQTEGTSGRAVEAEPLKSKPDVLYAEEATLLVQVAMASSSPWPSRDSQLGGSADLWHGLGAYKGTPPPGDIAQCYLSLQIVHPSRRHCRPLPLPGMSEISGPLLLQCERSRPFGVLGRTPWQCQEPNTCAKARGLFVVASSRRNDSAQRCVRPDREAVMLLAQLCGLEEV